MKYAYAFTKLFMASIIGGLCMRYTIPSEVDIFGSVVGYLYSTFVLNTEASIISSFNLNDYLLTLMVLPIILGPLIYCVVIGRWGLFTFILGFLAGYYLLLAVRPEFSLPTLLVAVGFLSFGSITTIYARTR
ncbi:MAG: hypothetical protein LUO93_09860 [Methanomicrobiales archaeon]|nr:hypothetical protein [Methanomicrobiales archaeon]